jgi:hypothetical protein
VPEVMAFGKREGAGSRAFDTRLILLLTHHRHSHAPRSHAIRVHVFSALAALCSILRQRTGRALRVDRCAVSRCRPGRPFERRKTPTG